MKRILILFLLLFSVFLYGADLRNFEIIIGGADPEIAGAPIPVTVRAYDTDGVIKTDYTGIAGFSETGSGQIIVEETGTNLTQAFINGIWKGKIKILRADSPITLILSDASGATGTVTKNIIPGSYSKLKMIVDGMTFAPGTLSGHTGNPASQTTGAMTPVYVTVYACDQYYNLIYTNLPTSVYLYTIPTSSNVQPNTPVNFTVEGKPFTVFSVAAIPSPDKSMSYNINVRDNNNYSITDVLSVYFASLTDFYIWADAPLTVVAGQNFTVTVNVSHFPPRNTSYVAGFTDAVQICAIDTNGNSTTIPGLLPYPTPIQSCVNGQSSFEVKYTKAGQIRIKPNNAGSTVYSNENDPNSYSYIINVLPAAPDSFTFVSDKERIKTGKTAVLSATVYDAYLNPVSNTAVNFSIIEGLGTLNTITAYTNSIGIAEIIFTAAASNTITTVRATVPAISQSKEVKIVSQLTDKFEMWPNPFNPNKGPVKINFPLESACKVKVEIFTVFGQKLWAHEIDGIRGGNTVLWDGKVTNGFLIGSGLYVVKISYKDITGSHTMTRKMAVIK
ncbi:MAG: hypothetical protein N3E50_06220, partial [Candidatus Goldbacteria bacterium]|nr:hypothetical protein [Candidatus Goldiibacteriota bacterium]